MLPSGPVSFSASAKLPTSFTPIRYSAFAAWVYTPAPMPPGMLSTMVCTPCVLTLPARASCAAAAFCSPLAQPLESSALSSAVSASWA